MTENGRTVTNVFLIQNKGVDMKKATGATVETGASQYGKATKTGSFGVTVI